MGRTSRSLGPAGTMIGFAAGWASRRTAQVHRRGHSIDPLTRLPDRRALLVAAERCITRMRAQDRGCGLLLVDLARFRSINDALGHAVGDRLLEVSAHRLREMFHGGPPEAPSSAGRPVPGDSGSPVVARIGCDEFAVLFPQVDDTASLRGLAAGVLRRLAEPVRLDGLHLTLEASVGICTFPEGAHDAETLLRHADAAMACAQRRHSMVELYDEARDIDTPERIGLLGDLRRALEQAEIQLHYQPIVSMDGRVTALEALLRWNRPGHGQVPPNEFIGLAESSGLMPQLTGYAVDRAAAQLSWWRSHGMRIPVAVNIAPSDIIGPGFAEQVIATLSRHRVPPRALGLEITERQLLDDPGRAADTLAELRRHGVRISLDDFGTGYSSLSRLCDLPIDEIKIDRSFVSEMASDDHEAAVVRCSVELAHTLGLTAVAEGVEDHRTWRRLRTEGIDAIQGWLICAAMPPDRTTAWLLHRPPPQPVPAG
ncbi:bifunctional diguanylate cyclase/phosphodiesterase [Kitasatospora sp. NPDC048540]|uniref:putative bifunctional diguanylate cyclase/phosphodiesterase n=1 Tax=Kitasatospora sp. NPDC048540 TaxID=3155634 RepID=UPI0033E95043